MASLLTNDVPLEFGNVCKTHTGKR